MAAETMACTIEIIGGILCSLRYNAQDPWVGSYSTKLIISFVE